MTKERILIVDDDRTTSKIVELQLRKMGYSVVSIANSGQEAFLQTEFHNPDLVLMDINLGGDMDGVEAADTIMHKYGVPVIYVTAYADDDTLARAKKTGPYGYINKPLRQADIKTTISLALERIRNQETSHSPDADIANIEKLEITYSSAGKIEKLDAQAQQLLKKFGFKKIKQILLKDNNKYINNCFKHRRSQLVNTKLNNRIFSWEYRLVEKDEGEYVLITIIDITNHQQLIDRNIQQASISEVLDRLSSGIIFINENLKVFYTNKSAEKLLQENRGFTLKDGHLNCNTADKTAELHKLVLDESSNMLTLSKRSKSMPLYILVSPLHSRSENYGHNLPIAIIYIFETINDSERIEDMVRVLYNLSPTEAKVAARLVSTPHIEEVASSLGITYNTARTHLKRIYLKTNTNRLSSLVHMIITGPVGFLIHSRES